MADLEVLLAKQAITERLHDYARGVDRIDRPLMRSVFHDDAHLDYGEMYAGPRDGFVDFIDATHHAAVWHQHHVGNVRIAVDPEAGAAGSECYVQVWLRFPRAEGGFRDVVTSGRYVDRWEHRSGEWRVVERRYLHGLDHTRHVDAAGYPPGGTRDDGDPSYAVLGLG